MCVEIIGRGLVVAYTPRRSISGARNWARNVGEESSCGTGICLNQVISEGSAFLASICPISTLLMMYTIMYSVVHVNFHAETHPVYMYV